MSNTATTGDAGDAVEHASSITWLRHNRVDLALHQLRTAINPAVRPLLILHGLGESSERVSLDLIPWVGPVYGLDFTGHGRSTIPSGGGYTCEVLVGDVDAAIDVLGPLTILGRGLGGYIGLITAAARPDRVHGVVLADGPGIAGGGVQPGSPLIVFPAPWNVGPPDPFAMLELARDVRPPDYAQNLLRLVSESNPMSRVAYVSAVARPEWLEAIINQPGVHTGTVVEALEHFGSVEVAVV